MFTTPREMWFITPICVTVGVGIDVEHVLEPIGAVGNLHRAPIGAAGLHPTIPVHMEPQDILIESVFRCPIANNESGMDQAPGDALQLGFRSRFSRARQTRWDGLRGPSLESCGFRPARFGGAPAPSLPFSPDSAGAPRCRRWQTPRGPSGRGLGGRERDCTPPTACRPVYRSVSPGSTGLAPVRPNTS